MQDIRVQHRVPWGAMRRRQEHHPSPQVSAEESLTLKDPQAHFLLSEAPCGTHGLGQRAEHRAEMSTGTSER